MSEEQIQINEDIREARIAKSVAQTKQWRQYIKDLTDEMMAVNEYKSRSRSLALTKLDEASMWLGKDLQELNQPNPYPTSRDASVRAIDPTAPEATNVLKS